MTVRAHKPEFNFREKLKELDGKLNKVDFPLTPTFRADLASNQTISSGVFTKYAAATVHWDNFNAFDTTNHRYVVPIGGVYLITFMNWWTSKPEARDIVGLYVNGSNVARDYAFSPTGGTLSVEFVWNLNASDYVEIYIHQASGSNQALDANNLNNGFTMTKIA